jgi:hypothetical protein
MERPVPVVCLSEEIIVVRGDLQAGNRQRAERPSLGQFSGLSKDKILPGNAHWRMVAKKCLLAALTFLKES